MSESLYLRQSESSTSTSTKSESEELALRNTNNRDETSRNKNDRDESSSDCDSNLSIILKIKRDANKAYRLIQTFDDYSSAIASHIIEEYNFRYNRFDLILSLLVYESYYL